MKTRKAWTQEEKKYLRDNFRKKQLKVIAAELGRTPSSIYNKLSDMSLIKCREWTQDEVNYLEDAYDRSKIEDIAKQLFRPVSTVRQKVYELGLHEYKKDNLTLYKVSKVIDIPASTLTKAARKGRLKTHGKDEFHHNSYIITIEDVREYILQYHPFRPLKCWFSGKEVMGDIFHPEHIPFGEKRKPVQVNVLHANMSEKDFRFGLSNCLLTMRLQADITQNDVSRRVGYTPRWYGRIETGEQEDLTLDTLKAITDALGWDISITFNKRAQK